MFFIKLFSFLRGPATTAPALFQNFPSVAEQAPQLRRLLQKQATPFFVIDRQTVVRRYQTLVQALTKYWGPGVVAYSFKTNYALAKSDILKRGGAWAEVVSGREYALAKKLGYPGKHIIFNGPLKTNSELAQAASDRALVQLDNKAELARLLSCQRRFRRRARLGLRLKALVPNVSQSRFGFSLEDGSALAALRTLREARLQLTSLHLHLGTDIDSLSSYQVAAQKLAQFCNLTEGRLRQRLAIIDLGGGFPGHGLRPLKKAVWSPQPLDSYIKTITLALKENLRQTTGKTLLVEPGRALVDDAAIFISKVYEVKQEAGTQKLLTDATISMLPLRYYRPQILKIYSAKLVEKPTRFLPTLIFGASCREDDLVSGGAYPRAEPSDYVVYFCVGAYNESLGSDFIFGKPKTFFI